jgi:polar amino acid transport system substrate-binding protein
MQKREFLKALGTAAIAAPVAALTSNAMEKHTVAPSDEKIYERVMRTRTIRCGYLTWPPILMKDPNTGEMSGIFYDYTEELGKRLGFKVEWNEEVGTASFVEGLKNNRFDAASFGVWPNASRAKEIDFSQPIYYIAIAMFVREGDTRFDGNAIAANDPNITISVMDGAINSFVAAEDFPKAKTISVSQNSTYAEAFLNVTTGKADIVLADFPAAREFMAHNPGKLRLVANVEPLRAFGNTIGIKKGEYELARMLNVATEEMLQSGVIDKILARYEKYHGSLYRVAKPYQPMAV